MIDSNTALSVNMDETDEFLRSLGSNTTIAVLPSGATDPIFVSEAILCQTSEYFVKALHSDFKEGSEKTLRFPGWSSEVVKYFIYWVYKHDLPDIAASLDGSHPASSADIAIEMTLVRLWLFGDAHMIPKLQNATMKILVACCEAMHTPVEVIRLACEVTSKDSPLYNLMIKQARFEYFTAEDGMALSEEQLEELASVPGFLAEFMNPLKRHVRDPNSTKKPDFRSVQDWL